MASHNDFRVKNGLVVLSTGTFLSTLTAISTQSGSVILSGGMGIAKDVWIGGTLNVIGGINATITGVITTATNLANGAAGQIHYQSAPGVSAFSAAGSAGQVLVSGGTGAPIFQSTLTLAGGFAATSTQSGTLQVVGGVGVGGTIYATGLSIAGISTQTGFSNFVGSGSQEYTVRFKGGATGDQWAIGTSGTAGFGIANDVLNAAGTQYSTWTVSASVINLKTGPLTPQTAVLINQVGQVQVLTNTPTNSNATGALIVTGGVGIAGGLFVSGVITGTTMTLTGVTASTSTTTGALTVAGGVGVQGAIYAGNIYSNGVLVGGSASTSTTATNLAGGFIGAVPYQSNTGTTAFAQGFAFNGSYLTVNTNTVLTTATVIGQVGIAVSATNSSVYLGFIPGAQGLTTDFGLIPDPSGAVIYDFGALN
jgi:hypothetical protein